MFWTLMPTEDDPRQSVTLCEHHALQETNSGLDLLDFGDPFGSMAEASAVLSAISAMAGYDYGLISEEQGECHMCEQETAASALSEEGAA